MESYLSGVINTVHILPFFPYSSDDGFSVIDYYKVRPALGSWDILAQFKKHGIKLMFDAVFNHVSKESKWFQGFTQGSPPFDSYFHVVDPDTDLSTVTRPRANPLLTRVSTSDGPKHVWTTFSEDQIDLNYSNPAVLLKMVDILLHYIDHGVDIIRLDAVSYIWKEIGTSCINLPQAHALTQLFRAILDAVAPGVLLITETNVPHEQNVAYFGNGRNEAHMVYQFSLPPLIAHALLSGSSTKLNTWAKGLSSPSNRTTFFNFTASHDGVGLLPAKGILNDGEIDLLIRAARAAGGGVSVRANGSSSQEPYEVNTTYFDLLNPKNGGCDPELEKRRFLVSQAIMLSLAGVPGIYFHSLLGSRNFMEGVKQENHLRAINRQKLNLKQLRKDLKEEKSFRHQVFYDYRHMIQCRIEQKAFHPNATQRVLSLGVEVFALLRSAEEHGEDILALHNLTGRSCPIEFNSQDMGLGKVQSMRDVLTDSLYSFSDEQNPKLTLSPYQALWLRKE